MKGIAVNRWAWLSEANRPEIERTLKVFLTEAAEAGYEALEDPSEEAAGYGLRICSSYAGGPFHLPWGEMNVEETFLGPARKVAALGGDHLVVNCDPKGSWGSRERKPEDDLKRQGENLSRLAEEVAPLGLGLVMHNHADSSLLHLDDLRSVTEFAHPGVGVCLDTGWAMTSGDDPVARVRELGPRLAGLHLRNQAGSVPTEWLGEGDIDMAALVRVLKGIGYAGWLTTELWHRPDVRVTRSLLGNQKRSVALLRRLWAGG